MKAKKFAATYMVTVEGRGGGDGKEIMTSQMVRDKILTALQEMWILHHLDGFSIQEVDPNRFEKFERGDEKVRSRKYS